ncbi:sulfotransferase [Novosphingobium sp. AP12]|uniref:tetratricopeptide repeat-containing sulfotransferase family protein n=1 Tax=Novosphingobium sp. AP12 TaxID=1144305 RepID=UPI00027214BE|nr:sulfotransferase [Novosphingobium sp. AP12]EJL30352.1 sulfotransferase family protein [Novosphingobium sp. AP12]
MASPAEALRLGREAVGRGQLDAAVLYFRAALDALPGDPTATIWLGQTLCAGGHLFEGTAHLREGVLARLRTAGGNPADLLPAALLLQKVGDAASSLEVLDAIAETGFDTPSLWHSTATAAAQLVRHDVALEACRKGLALAPGHSGFEVLTASIEIDARQADTALGRLDRLLGRPLPDRERFRTLRERARALDRVGRHREVFADLAASTALAPQLPEYAAQDHDLVSRLLAKDAAGFDASMFRRWRGGPPADDGPAPIFLLGYLRSGTTLMQEVLACHLGVMVADEVPLLAGTHAALPAGQKRLAILDALDRPAIAKLRARYRHLAAVRLGPDAGNNRMVDKFALNVIDLPVILRLFPEAPILFMVRDPRDACLSSVLQLMPPSPSTVNLLDWHDAVRFHALITASWRHYRDALGLHASEVRYEALVGDLEGTMRKVLAPLGLEWNDTMRVFHKNAATRAISTPSRSQVTRPLDRASMERWRDYAPEIAQIEHIIAPALHDWGY